MFSLERPKLSHPASDKSDYGDEELQNPMIQGEEGSEDAGSEDGKVQDESELPSFPSNRKRQGLLDGLRDIQDAAELYQSSSFKLQIDALLPNVRPKLSPDRITPLERTLHALHALLKQIPSISHQHPLDAARKMQKKGIAVPYPYPGPSKDTNWKVSFEPPSDITLVGSWANQVSVKSKDGAGYGVDLAVEMPDELFQEKDYLNFRFFHKRAFYLAALAHAISSNNALQMDVQYVSLSNDPRMTVLELRSRKGHENDISGINAYIRVLPVLSATSPIPRHRLSPSSSNIRNSSSTEPSDPPTTTATPLYNNTLLTNLTPRPFIISTLKFKKTALGLADALTLLRIWANQRGYGDGQRFCVQGFENRGFWWSLLLVYLIDGEDPAARAGRSKASKRKPLGGGLSSYQLFRAALDFLASHDFGKNPVFIKTETGLLFSTEDYASHHDAVFVDSSSTVNLLAGIPINSLELLKADAKKTLEGLNQTIAHVDPFSETFLQDQRDLSSRFDAIIGVDLSSVDSSKLSAQATLEYGSPSNALLASLNSILRQGLGDRTKAIAVLHHPSSFRPISQAHPTSHPSIHIGLLYNGDNAFRIVDHGPAAEDEGTIVMQEFKKLWGPKAELRRFQDGRITHSVVWEVKTVDERSRIPVSIVKYLLCHHFGILDEVCQTWQKGFDSLIKLPDPISQLYASSPTAVGFAGARAAFEMLVKTIKGLGEDELPLTLSSVSPTSEYLRSTSVFAPTPLFSPSIFPTTARYQPFIDLVLEFEKSSRWPDDLGAIQKVKLAFFEHIATALMTASDKLIARVAVGDVFQQSDIMDKARLEVITAEGWAFALRISHDRELTLLDRIINHKPNQPAYSLTPPSLTPASVQDANTAKFVHLQRFVHGPRHHRAINALFHQYPAFSGTVRLVKRWFASHWLLQSHVTAEAVEIICASLFIQPGSGGQPAAARIPQSKERGFAMVMRLLAEWKWEEGLNVLLYGEEVGSSDKKASFKPPVSAGVWKVATEMDREGHMWTAKGPDSIVARRIKVVAKATWEHLDRLDGLGGFDVKALFIHPTDDYDFIIHLKSSDLPRYAQNVSPDPNLLSLRREGKYVNLPSSKENSASPVLRPGFDIAQLFFDDLQRIYADSIIFFYDVFGGDRIGAVWYAKLKEPRPFRVLGGFSSMPVQTSEKDAKKGKLSVMLNEVSVLAEIERMGKGIVKSITVQKSDNE